MKSVGIRTVLVSPLLVSTVLAAAAALVAGCGASAAPVATTTTVTATATPGGPASSTPAASTNSAPAAPSTSGPAYSGCLTRYLHASIGATQGAAGSIYSEIVFTNVSNVSCTMYGFPGVSVSPGRPIKLVGATAAENPASARQLVTLPPGGTAHALLRVTEAGNYAPGSCHAVTVRWLQVIPPNQVAPLYIRHTTQTCRDTATRTMTISAVRPGPGNGS